MEDKNYKKYKNILWIDDCDDKDSDFPDDFLQQEKEGEYNDSFEIIKDYFPKDYESVRLIKEFKVAINELKNNNFKYDLVVFDIDLKNGIGTENDYNDIDAELRKKRVLVRDKGEEFNKRAGMYLYLYLLNCGYPNHRMVILTGNVSDIPESFLEEAHILPISDPQNEDRFIFGKSGGQLAKADSDWIESFYREEYYQVRKLVFKACEYWKEKLVHENDRENKGDKIAFNQIYYKNNKESWLEPEVLSNMLEGIKMLYPVAIPENCKRVYFQTLQQITSFHEESADIKILDGKQGKKYHQAVRNFRNWAAHNKFSSNEIDAELFLYMFCLTLRTYFEKEENQFEINSKEKAHDCYWIYEKEFFDKIFKKTIDIGLLKEKYKTAFIRHLEKLKMQDKKSNKNGRIPMIYECRDVQELLLFSGKVYTLKEDEKMQSTDLLMNIMDGLIVQKDKRGGIQNGENTWEYKVEYCWDMEIKESEIQSMINDKEEYFKYIAYVIFGNR